MSRNESPLFLFLTHTMMKETLTKQKKKLYRLRGNCTFFSNLNRNLKKGVQNIFTIMNLNLNLNHPNLSWNIFTEKYGDTKINRLCHFVPLKKVLSLVFLPNWRYISTEQGTALNNHSDLGVPSYLMLCTLLSKSVSLSSSCPCLSTSPVSTPCFSDP